MDLEVKRANDQLKLAKSKVRLWQKEEGGVLYLRATLPPKPRANKDKPYQQTIPLRFRPTVAGVKRAVQEAKRLDLSLSDCSFQWADWLETILEQGPTMGEWIPQLERQFFLERGETSSSRNTWRKDYLSVFNRVPAETELTESTILDLITTHSDPNSRSRKRWCQALKLLAKYAELPVRLDRIQRLSGNYGKAGTIKPRQLPTDDEILEVWKHLPDEKSRWVWGMMATFGLRNFECWFVDVADLLAGGFSIKVLITKTKVPRTAHALPQPWVDQMELRREPVLGKPDPLKTNGDLGQMVTRLFCNRGLPGPYNLRHAWRQRAVKFGIDPSVAARSLGHSVNISQQTYTAWLNEETSLEAFAKAHQVAVEQGLLPTVETVVEGSSDG